MHLRRRLVFLALSALLFAGSVYRAATYPFVHDESLSFAIFTWEPPFRDVANHHWLNTWTMEASARLFGSSELALRLPNLLAHLVYLGCGLALLRRLREPAVQCGAFVALQLNPFLLDYFCLARGYGLGLAALSVSLVLLARAVEEAALDRRRRLLLGALAAGAVAVLANFSFLFFHLTLHAVAGVFYFPRGARRVDRPAIAAMLLGAIFLAVVFARLRWLAQRGELYFGGAHGFFQDTVWSLVEGTLYRAGYPAGIGEALALALVSALLAVCGTGLWVSARARRFGLDAAFTLLLAGSVLLPIGSHALGASLLPMERAALAYVPLAAVALAFTLARWQRARPAVWRSRGLGGAALAGAAHFGVTYNLFTCHTWAYDAHDRTVLELVVRDHLSRRIAAAPRLAVGWHFLPSFTFYRVSGPGSWLAPLRSWDARRGDEDYAYGFAAEAGPWAAENYQVLARFSDTGTILLRRR